ncbi:MAG: class I SAM-dependent methyltransferase [Desulfobacterales bacterium]|nr:class I SAM-dependent methyltransferase [Desulfobacterales bacterium]
MDYYQRHSQAYFDETVGVDPAPFLNPFAERLFAGARVLDVGCGSGRDLLWLKSRGVIATGVERSQGLAALARTHSGCPVMVGDFETVDFSALQVDAVMCCGSLVHVSHERLEWALKNIVMAFRDDAPPTGPEEARDRQILYVSLKEGQGASTDDRGRIFYYWQDEALRAIFAGLGFEVADFLRSPSADGEGKSWLGYVLVRP